MLWPPLVTHLYLFTILLNKLFLLPLAVLPHHLVLAGPDGRLIIAWVIIQVDSHVVCCLDIHGRCLLFPSLRSTQIGENRRSFAVLLLLM